MDSGCGNIRKQNDRKSKKQGLNYLVNCVLLVSPDERNRHYLKVKE
jgi:hypothetical protein